MSPNELVDLHLPRQIQFSIFVSVLRAYADASSTFDAIFPSKVERLNGIGNHRRLHVDRELRAIFNAHPQLKASAPHNSRRTSRFTRLEVPGKLVVLPAQTQEPGGLPRRAAFRREHLILSQWTLWDDHSEELQARPVAVLLTHGARDLKATAPEWLRFAFPNAAGSFHAYNPIDLMTRFAVQSITPEEETVHDEEVVVARPAAAEEGQSGGA